ncbi:MAG: hypothetical protein HWE21_18145 [Cytophagia bacterium]|nr:hypothetical protein [Cytophagia bacterium]
MLTRLFIFLTLVLLFNASSFGQVRETKTFRDFPKEVTLEHSKVKINEALTPSTIHLLDNVVILVDQKSDPAIHFYNINDWSLMSSYGKKGDGPAEVKIPKFHGQFEQENNKTYLWFSDFRSTKLLKLGLKDMIENIDTEPVISYKMPYEVGMLYDDIYALSDTEFFGTVEGNVVDFTGENSGRFFIADIKKKSLNWIPNFPTQSLKTPPEKVGYLYSSNTILNKHTHQIASAMKYYDRIDIIDLKKNSVLTIVQEDKTELTEVDLNDKKHLIPLKTRSFYGGGYSSENYMYFWYLDTTVQQGVDFYNVKTSDYPNRTLHIFNWAGEPILKVQLDKHNLGSFFVDENSWMLYAIDHDPVNEDEVIVSYQLPNLNKK